MLISVTILKLFQNFLVWLKCRFSRIFKSSWRKTDRVILGELGYFKNFDAFVNKANLPLLKDYMKYHMLSGNAGVLDKKTRRYAF